MGSAHPHSPPSPTVLDSCLSRHTFPRKYSHWEQIPVSIGCHWDDSPSGTSLPRGRSLSTPRVTPVQKVMYIYDHPPPKPQPIQRRVLNRSLLPQLSNHHNVGSRVFTGVSPDGGGVSGVPNLIETRVQDNGSQPPYINSTLTVGESCFTLFSPTRSFFSREPSPFVISRTNSLVVYVPYYLFTSPHGLGQRYPSALD